MDEVSDVELTPISIRVHPSDAEDLDTRVEGVLQSLAGIFDSLREHCELPPAESLEVIVAADLAVAVRAEADRTIGVEDLTEYGIERLGGMVVGKTMFRDEEHRRIIIVLSADIFESSDSAARALELYLVSHEMAHGLLGQLRSESKIVMKSSFLPWEISRWFARYALEEYIADSMAELVLRQCGHATDADGAELVLSKRLVAPHEPEFVTSAHEGLQRMVDRLDQYRLDGKLESMWADVQDATSNIFITLAHAQAEIDDLSDGSTEAVTASMSSELGPLHDTWEEMRELFVAYPLLCNPERFAEATPHLLDQAGALLIDFWAHIGLSFRPAGDGSRMTVAPPHEAWPGNLE